jgi:cellulose synthase/poly-beta-1,6-N-acetylglucosamine synthase-like glycosyltransferase
LQAVEIAVTLLLFCFVCLQFTLLFSILNLPKQTRFFRNDESLPSISILIAARNEEKNIINCLKSLELLDYPQNKLEIIIGNDQSTDRTAELVAEFTQNKCYFKTIEITENLGNAKAKANVLAHLFNESTGTIIFVTDADIQVKPTWVKSILPYFENLEVGIVSGTTVVNGTTLFDKMQSIDWLYFSGLLTAFDNLGLKSTAVGNNMALTKTAYQATGGYPTFNFSVTEDLTLFTAITKQGFNAVNLLESSNLNFSKPQISFKNLLHQRKRWLIGAQDLNLKWKMLFALMGLFYPCFLVLLFFSFKNAIALLLCKFLIQTGISILVSKRLQIKTNIFHLILFEIYSIISTFAISIFYVLPIKMNWKERNY